MGKKQRHKQQSRPILKMSGPVAVTPAPQSSFSDAPMRSGAAVQGSQRARPGTEWSEFSQRYTHVNTELKQIGIIAGSFLVVLLVLTGILS